MRIWTLLATGLLCAGITHAESAQANEEFTLELQAGGGALGFNLPFNSIFTNATVALNDRGDVAFALDAIDDGAMNSGIWFGQGGKGSVVYELPPDMLASDPSLNSDGLLVFEQHALHTSDGVFSYDSKLKTVTSIVPPQRGFNGTHSPRVNDRGEILFWAEFSAGRHAHMLAQPGQDFVTYARNVALDRASPYSYLFRAAINNSGDIAAKMRFGGVGEFNETQADDIRLFTRDGQVNIIAKDRDSDATSPFLSFDNSVAINNHGAVAFIATLAGKDRGIWIKDGEQLRELARSGTAGIAVIESFGLTLNDNGAVAFRAIDDQRKRAIYLIDGDKLVKVVTEGELVTTNIGPAQVGGIGEHYPAFGGGIALNNHGDVAFQCVMTSANTPTHGLGSAVFIAYRK